MYVQKLHSRAFSYRNSRENVPAMLRTVCTRRSSGVQIFFTCDEPEITLCYSAFDFLSGLTNFPQPIKISVIGDNILNTTCNGFLPFQMS